ncbi:uncharacterized protein CEXT_448271 [Caerostris extrusa]|uniref:Uncharacterized protein n=1 Tax=Caerostris extrusa TaxID=172846 RepID=A0AAV4QX82_CAEEX|nr:uncharacterized protein CEXT_448271 [Caerostris extrusa]
MGHILLKEQKSLARDNGSLFIAFLTYPSTPLHIPSQAFHSTPSYPTIPALLICLMKLDRRKYHFRFSTTLPRFPGFFPVADFALSLSLSATTITYFLQRNFCFGVGKIPSLTIYLSLRGVFDECGGIGGLLGRCAPARGFCKTVNWY